MIRGRDSGGCADWAHAVQFYDNQAFLAARVGTFLGEGLAAGDLTIVIATDHRRETLQKQLESKRCDVAYACASGQLAFLDARETLSRFMRRGEPDRALFESAVSGIISQRSWTAPGARIRAFGEMVDVLWQRGERYAAFRLEELWNDLIARHSLSLLCAYDMSGFRDDPEALHWLSGTHTLTCEGESTSDAKPIATAPTSPPALPSEYARWLAQEVGRREALERALVKLLAGMNQMRDTAQQLQDARRSEAELRSILDSLPLLVAYVDVNRRYRFVNAAYERWFGRAALHILGKHLGAVLGNAAYEAVRPHVDRTFAGHGVTYAADFPHRDGAMRTIETTHVPRFAEDGRVVGYVALSATSALPASP